MIARRPSLALCIVLVATATSGCGEQDKRLDSEQIQTLYSDKIIHGRHLLKKFGFRSYYSSDGSFVSYRDAQQQPRLGTWWVRDDHMCIRWAETEEEYCRIVIRDRHGRYRKVLLRRSGDEADIVEYLSIEPGHVDDLGPSQ